MMKHGISEVEWNDYLDGLATADESERIEAHLAGCLACWEMYQMLLSATEELMEASEEARQELTLRDGQLHAMMRGVFSRLRAGQPGGAAHSQVQGQLNMLKTVLAPFCGTHAAARALQVAAKNSPARSLERVTKDNWEPFLDKLTAIAAAMCGDTFGGLVRERGQF
jgi:anti-sigma factor RsiW